MSDIPTWMLTDKLKLNDDKTEFMLLGTKQQLSKVNIDSLTVGSIDVAPVTVARNLGTWFDSCLLYTSDAADEEDSVDLGGRRIIKKKRHK